MHGQGEAGCPQGWQYSQHTAFLCDVHAYLLRFMVICWCTAIMADCAGMGSHVVGLVVYDSGIMVHCRVFYVTSFVDVYLHASITSDSFQRPTSDSVAVPRRLW